MIQEEGIVRPPMKQSKAMNLSKRSLYDPLELQIACISNWVRLNEKTTINNNNRKEIEGTNLMCIVPIWFW